MKSENSSPAMSGQCRFPRLGHRVLIALLILAGLLADRGRAADSPTSAGAIQFAQAAYTVGESAGTVTLVALRTGGSSNAVAGYYRTANGTATAGLDYSATTNVVTWASGDAAPKNIVLTILNNGLVELTETFTVTFFTTSGGATLGTLATATVTITDDDTVIVPENHPPVLPATVVLRVLKLVEMVVTNTATDSDLPAQTLTYELLARPDGATIDADGIVRWTPPTASTNYFQTKVTDNGSPAKSATNSFYVIVTEPVVVLENHPPVLPGPTAVFRVLKLVEMVVTNTATDSDLPAQTLTYELLARPDAATIDANGIVRWTPPTASTNYFQTKVTDNGSPAKSATNSFYVIVTEPVVVSENHPPVLPGPTAVFRVLKLVEMVVTNTATDSDLPAQTLTYELLARPDGATIDANGIVRWTPPTASTNYFQTKVTDDGSPAKSATNSFYVIVTEPVVVPENHPPVLPGPTTIFHVLKLVEMVVTNTATDSDLPAQTLTYELLAKPEGATIDANGIVRWTPPTVSTNYFQTKVTDNGSPAKSATNSFYVIVTEPVVVSENHPPVLPGPTAVFRVLKLVEMVVTNTATDSDLPAQTLTYELLAKPDGATIDADGIVRWTPPTVSTNYFQTKVTDNGSPAKSATNSFYVIVSEPVVVPENHPPVLPPPFALRVPKLVEVVVTNTATDSDLPAQTLTYELLAKPDGATIDADGIVRWTPPTASTNSFQTKVTDNGSPAKSATNSFYVIATELDVVTENHAPVLPEPTVFTTVKLTELVVTNTATDSDLPAQTLTYELLSKPEGATIDAHGIVRWTPPTAGTNYFQTKVTDNGSPAKSATNSFYVIVTEPVVVAENHPPVLPPTVVLHVRKLVEVVVTNTATDSDLPAQTLTYELLASPTGATIDANGVIRWTPPTAGTNYFLTKVTDSGSPAKSATNVLYIIATELDIVTENHTPTLPHSTVVTVKKLTEMVFTNTATDYDVPAQTLTYELLARPDGATIDADGIVRWTPTLTQGPSTNRFRTKVTDNGTPARSATNVFYAIVTEGNTAPVLYGRSSFTVTNAAGFSESYAATDSDTPANTLAFSLVSGPTWLAFTKTDEHRAQLTGTPPVVTAETHFTAVLQVMDNGAPPLAKQLTVRITLLAAPPAPATCFVTRRLPAGYVPGTALTVSLLITPPSDTIAYTVADAPPAGWTVGAISDAGQRDTVSGAVNFGPFTDAAARTLTYELTPPVTETGPKNFTGITYRNGAFTGVCGADVLVQLQYHPADANPADLRLTDAEVTTYAAAWKSGSAWPAGPNPIEVAFVTRAGYLARNGETYTVNPLAALPLAWIPTLHAPITAKVPTTLTTVPTGKGCWRFLPHKLAVGATSTVALIVNPAPSDFAYAVEETPPPGWTVGVVSAGGVYDATTGRVRWGLFQDQTSRTLTYELTPTGALAPFTGVASFDGTNLPIAGVSQPEVVSAITESEFAPATRLPSGEMILPLATRDGTITVIEFSDDLRLWTPIWTNTPGSQLFRDLPLNVRAGRFYRSNEQ